MVRPLPTTAHIVFARSLYSHFGPPKRRRKASPRIEAVKGALAFMFAVIGVTVGVLTVGGIR